MTYITQYDGKLKHKQDGIAKSLALKTGRSVASCRVWLTYARLGYRAYPPRLNKTDWGYVKGIVYFTDKGRDKIANYALTMRGPISKKTTT